MHFKKVVITGASGFVGSWITRNLQADHQINEVVGINSKDYDLRDSHSVQCMFRDIKPDVVIHAAGHVGGIGANQAAPADFFYDNILMGAHTMHYAYKYNVKRVIMLGTVCSYPSHTDVPFKEDDIWNGYPEPTNAPYGIAKRALLAQAMSYRKQYDFDVRYVLPTNMYGPNDSHLISKSHVIPALILKFFNAHQQSDPHVTLWGDGSPTREFLFAEDAAKAVQAILHIDNLDGPINIGSSREISIFDLATLISSLIGYKGKIHWDTTRPNGQQRRCLDTSKAQELLGFEATTSLEYGLKLTIDWFLENIAPNIKFDQIETACATK